MKFFNSAYGLSMRSFNAARIFYKSCLGVTFLYSLCVVNLSTDVALLKRGPVYGPWEKLDKYEKNFSFDRVKGSFLPVPLRRFKELKSGELQLMILSGVSKNVRKRAALYITHTLKMAEEYQIDPLWAVSIMWTESHFNPHARSSVNAIGLMQVMPGTGHYLMKKLNRPMGPKLAYELTKDPLFNIRLGVFYLKRLLKRFGGSYRFATVAYNMGPTSVRRRLRFGLPVGKRNLYLDKVRRHYLSLSRPVRLAFFDRPHPYQDTFVARQRSSSFLKTQTLDEWMSFQNNSKKKAPHSLSLLEGVGLIDAKVI